VTWTGAALSTTAEDAFRVITYPMKGYPELKMFFNAGHSHLSARVNANLTAKGYMSPNIEFILTLTPWWGGTDRYSDIVMPLCTILETDDMSSGSSSIHSFILYQTKCIEPMGESKSDFEATLALATRLGIADKFAEGKSKDQILRAAFAKSDVAKLMSYEDFQKVGYVYNPTVYDENYKPNVGQRWFYDMKGEQINANTGFRTPSGKVEFFSQVIYKFLGTNDPKISPVPKYYQAREGKYSPVAKTYPLTLLTPHRFFRFHGMYDNVSLLRDCYKVAGPDGYEHEPVYISPADASARGIKDRDIVRVFNDRGAVLAGARITKTLLPSVVQLHQAAWYEPADPRNPYLEKNGSCNVLTHSQGQSDFARITPDVTANVQVEVWKG
jgi:trimethylamine-N-oxide reductase (cytochrome c)